MAEKAADIQSSDAEIDELNAKVEKVLGVKAEEYEFSKPQSTSEWIMEHVKKSFGLSDEDKPFEQIVESLDLLGIAKFISDGHAKNIIVMAGAGISTAAGIPDFRSPNSGLFNTLDDYIKKYNVGSAQELFCVEFFSKHPEPFYEIRAGCMYGENAFYKPTMTHCFIRLLQDKGLLKRHYTQNIDGLERLVGVDPVKLVECHGTWQSAHCFKCGAEVSLDHIRAEMKTKTVPLCRKPNCGGVVKPDIVFFGESMPPRFSELAYDDFAACDLLIILGTSLTVMPFAGLVSQVKHTVPRLYINMELQSRGVDMFSMFLGIPSGLRCGEDDNYRDVFQQGTCDDGCLKLAELLNWKEELLELHKTIHKKLDSERGSGNLAASAARTSSSSASKSKSPKSSSRKMSPRTVTSNSRVRSKTEKKK